MQRTGGGKSVSLISDATYIYYLYVFREGPLAKLAKPAKARRAQQKLKSKYRWPSLFASFASFA